MAAMLQTHLGDISLAYAAALLMLGAVLTVSPRKEATLPCAPDLWLIAVFALVRGAYELAVLRAMGGSGGGVLPPWVSAPWMLAAYLPLFEFGRRVLQASMGTPAAPGAVALLRPPLVYGAAAIGIAGLALWSSAPAPALMAGARVFLGFPGAALTGVGLLRHWGSRRRPSAPASLGGHVALAGFAAIAYGLLSLVLLGIDARLPVWIPTEDRFSAVFGIPVQLPRALAAVVMTYALIQAVYRANVRKLRLEQELEDRQSRLLDAEGIGHLGSWDYDPVTDMRKWSPEMYRIFGFDPAQAPPISRDTIVERVHPEDRAAWVAEFQRSLEGRATPGAVRFRLRLPDGTGKTVDTWRRFEPGSEGRNPRLFGVVQDVTERVRAEEALRATQHLQESILEGMPGFVGLFAPDGTLLHANRLALDAQGLQPEVKVGKLFWNLFHWNYSEAVQEELRGAFFRAAAGETVRTDLVARLDSQRFATVDITFSPIRDAAGRVLQIVGTGIDITERVRAEETLRETQRRQQSILDSMYAFVGLFGLDGTLLDLNRAPLEAAGVRREDVVGKPFWETVWFAHDPRIQEQLRSILGRVARGEAAREEIVVHVAGGGLITMDATFSPIRDAAGQVIQIVGSGVDVTDRVRAREALRVTETRLQQTIEALPAGFLLYDADERLVLWNRYMGVLFPGLLPRMREGMSYEEATRLSMVHFSGTPEARERAYEQRIRTFRSGTNSSLVELADGRTVQFANLRTASGATICLRFDVTEERRKDVELDRQRQFLENLIAIAPVIVLLLNREGRIDHINPYLEDLSGYRLEEVRGQDWYETFLPDRERARIRSLVATTVAGTASRGTVNAILTREGQERQIAWSDSPLRDGHGEIVGVLAIGHDVTEQTRATDRIAVQLREKEVLLREIHHRVKNNLQIVSSLLYLQQQQAQRPEDTAVLRESRNRVAAMALVHEKLYSSSNLAEVDLVEYARDLAQSLLASFGADPERVALRVEGKRFPLPLDRAITWGLLVNEIVSNSLKHAFPGEMSGEIAFAVAEREGVCELTIRDNGVGHGFSDGNQPKGSLGLRLIPRLAEQLGAAIERMEGPGTGYRVLLPKEGSP